MPVPVLHCHADYKWTGPSEPVVRLCQMMSERGWTSHLACMQAPPEDEDEVGTRAQAGGVTVFRTFRTRCGLNPVKIRADFGSISRLVRDGGYGIVHCHGSWDHFVVGWARRLGGVNVRVLRTDHGAREYKDAYLWRYYFGPKMIDHLVVLSDRHAVQAVGRLRLPPENVTTIRGAVDTDAFHSITPPMGHREKLGVGEKDIVFGLVARIQRHRRWDVFLKAARIVQGRDPRVRFVVCGRGTHKESVLDRPIAEMGLGGTVIAAGYRRGDYMETLASFDAGVLMMPGTDGSCRAAMQMAAMGKPMVVTRRGVLPDVVIDGKTGIVVEDGPEELADAFLEMASDAERMRQWGAAGRERMCTCFSIGRQADQVEQVYRRLLA